MSKELPNCKANKREATRFIWIPGVMPVIIPANIPRKIERKINKVSMIIFIFRFKKVDSSTLL
jgi:hypothetical protein